MTDDTPPGRPGEAPTQLSRRERRTEKRRLHEAQKKARAVDKANDKRYKGANRQEKKARKTQDQAQKKTDKGKTDKADKKVDKGGSQRPGNQR